ncbi:hypothetical protein [Chryseobacterium wanjuense]
MLQKHRYNIANSPETLMLEKQNNTGLGITLSDEEIANYPTTDWEKIF